jgi:DNA polymerase-3 subunit gamma/tau
MDAFAREEPAVRFSSQPRLALEMAFIRLFQIRPALPIETLMEKLDELAGQVAAAPAGAVVRQQPAPRKEAPGRPPSAAAPPKPAPAPEPMLEPESPVREAPPPPDTPPPDAGEWDGAVPDPGPPPASEDHSPQAGHGLEAPPTPEPLPECRLPEIPADTTYDPEAPLEATWEKLTSLVCGRSSALGAYLTRATLSRIGEEALEITVHGNSFNLKQIQKKQEIIQEAARALFGRNLRLMLRLDDAGGQSRQKKIEQDNAVRQEAMNHPLVEAAIEIFDGKVVDIKIL